MACKAAKPPPNSRAIAMAPSRMAQKIRWEVGAFTLPPEVMLSITNEPESDEVIKNTSTSTMAMRDVSSVSGRPLSMIKSSSTVLSANTPCRVWLMAVPPKAVIHSTETNEGTSSTEIRNSRTVRPRETRAMNIPTKGDQEIHQAQ